MIESFADQETRDIFDGRRSKPALKRLDVKLWSVAQRKLHMIKAATKVEDLRVPPGNRLEILRGEFKDYYSIRINDQYRVIFQWNGQDAIKVKIIDYH